jgi:hypothetical protein
LKSGYRGLIEPHRPTIARECHGFWIRRLDRWGFPSPPQSWLPEQSCSLRESWSPLRVTLLCRKAPLALPEHPTPPARSAVAQSFGATNPGNWIILKNNVAVQNENFWVLARLPRSHVAQISQSASSFFVTFHDLYRGCLPPSCRHVDEPEARREPRPTRGTATLLFNLL